MPRFPKKLRRSPGEARIGALGFAGVCLGGGIVLALFASVGCGAPKGNEESAGSSTPPARIVSMAPSLTETLFALGVGDRVVGVTNYCDFPAETAAKARVGGFFDPNYEIIVSLRPDLVVLLSSQEEAKARLNKLGIRTLCVDHERVASIVDSIERIGEAVGAREKAREIADDMKKRIDAVEKRVAALGRPSVLVSIGRNMGSAKLEEVYVAGPKSLYDDLIGLAGGRNVLQDSGILYPSVSYEGILKLNPDVVIDMVGDLSKTGLTADRVLAQWAGLSHVRAVENKRVYVLEGAYAVRPGPRFVLTLEDAARRIHPDAQWDSP